ncbi:MAG: ABC transporter ATP-binding protein [Verrucomicrobia bacterium]|nr:ABC transporter ATP-binding protein [Verrucomicrobiota bacterium]
MKAIRTNNLGKKYRIDKVQEFASRQLSDDLMRMLRGEKLGKEDFWALREVDLEIEAGETVGIIGPNGSGKSTLLKLLARVTWPTTGRIELYGRVGALLEVGTGFHIDLTGRENIFLAGAILGMNRREVKSHFDEIINFSGVEEFLDVPVKRYSNGMFLRLAFSVMAYLRNEILIVDEILAVGDQEFQVKCLKKMETIAQEGRTVIFVSHQLEMVHSLCSRILTMERGLIVSDCKAALQV